MGKGWETSCLIVIRPPSSPSPMIEGAQATARIGEGHWGNSVYCIVLGPLVNHQSLWFWTLDSYLVSVPPRLGPVGMRGCEES